MADICYGSSVATTTPNTASTAEAFKTTLHPKSAVVSPFSQAASGRLAASSTASHPVLPEHGFFRLVSASSHASSTSTNPAAVFQLSLPKSTTSRLLAGATTASILFGTKTLVEGALQSQHDTSKHHNDTSGTVSEISSALAGVTVATASRWQSSGQFLVSAPSSPLFLEVARHAVGATVYFASYQALKSFLIGEGGVSGSTRNQNNHNNNNNMLAVAVSGATAGALYQGTLLLGASASTSGSSAVGTTVSPSAIRAINATAPTTASRIIPTMLRAAPAHALLFLGYEWVQRQP